MQSISSADYKGIDISNWQGKVDFTAVKASGIEIVYMKTTEGDYFKDPYLDSNYTNAKAAGLLVGFYHFFRPDVDAKAQAKYFVNAIGSRVSDCLLALDIEVSDGNNSATLSKMCLSFLEETEKLSSNSAVLYTYTYFAQTNLTNLLADYPLWIAHYGVTTPGSNPIWDSWVGFQYSSTGDIPGVNGPCDLDVFTKDILLSRTKPPVVTPKPPVTPPVEPPKPPVDNSTVKYTVQPGDTLSSIAIAYNTSWVYIAELNNLSNPGLIYPGQVLTIKTGSTPLPPCDSKITYTVLSGDSLSKIAAKYNTTWQYLAQINSLTPPYTIYPGEILTINSSSPTVPPTNTTESYVVQEGDTLSGIAAKYSTTWQHLAQINNITDANMIYPGTVLIITLNSSTPPVNTQKTYKVKAGDTLSGIAAANNTTWQKLASINNLGNPSVIFPGDVLTIG